MKKTLFFFSVLILCISAKGQIAKKPRLMVVPAKIWYNKNGFMQNDNQGKITDVPDYKRAFMESTELVDVITEINRMMTERGMDMINLESALKTLETNSAEDAMVRSKSGSEIVESNYDRLIAVAKADIIVEITWSVNIVGPKKSITFSMRGMDAYTDKQIAASPPRTGTPSFSTEMPVLLQEAVLSTIDDFNNELQKHFDDMFLNGREVVLRIRVWDSWGENLETEFGSGKEELSKIIEDWVDANTVQHRFSTVEATENKMLFQQVRIPLFDEKGKSIDTKMWARGLQTFLKNQFQISSKPMMKGLGQAQLVIGEK